MGGAMTHLFQVTAQALAATLAIILADVAPSPAPTSTPPTVHASMDLANSVAGNPDRPAAPAAGTDHRRPRFGHTPERSNETVQTIACGEEIPYSDENGTWQLRFQCFADYGVINWHYNLNASAQAIAASWATETGLRWWRNGVEQPRNARHFVPIDYTLHGTMSQAHVGDIVDYQDYITFRHNLGGGGTAAVTFAGSIRLVY